MPIPWAAIPPLAARGYAAYQAAQAIREQFCQIYQVNPGFFNRMIGAVPGGNYINPIIPFVCPTDDPPPTPLESPFNGGQCCGRYEVDLVGVIEGSTTSATFNANGKIGGLVWIETEGDPELVSGSWYLENGNDCPGTEPVLDFFIGGLNMQTFPSASIVAIRRVDGLPDDCGSPNPRLPFQIPGIPDLNFPITIPVGGQDINIPVSISFNAPAININIQPQINFNTPIGDFIFSPDGIDILFPGRPENPDGSDPYPPGTDAPDPRPPIDRPPLHRPPGQTIGRPVPGGGGGGGGGGCPPCPDLDLTPVVQRLDLLQVDVDALVEGVEELLDCDRCTRSRPELCIKRLVGTGQAEKFQLAADVEWVGIEVVERPDNWKGYLVEDSPEIVFAGWHEFGSLSASGERTQIQYMNNIYPVPDGASSFSFGLQTGYEADYYIYLRPEEEDDD